jgi:hypothetical protein
MVTVAEVEISDLHVGAKAAKAPPIGSSRRLRGQSATVVSPGVV